MSFPCLTKSFHLNDSTIRILLCLYFGPVVFVCICGCVLVIDFHSYKCYNSHLKNGHRLFGLSHVHVESGQGLWFFRMPLMPPALSDAGKGTISNEILSDTYFNFGPLNRAPTKTDNLRSRPISQTDDITQKWPKKTRSDRSEKELRVRCTAMVRHAAPKGPPGSHDCLDS